MRLTSWKRREQEAHVLGWRVVSVSVSACPLAPSGQILLTPAENLIEANYVGRARPPSSSRGQQPATRWHSGRRTMPSSRRSTIPGNTDHTANHVATSMVLCRYSKMVEWMDNVEMAIAKVCASKVYTSAEFKREKDNFQSLCKNLERAETKK